MTDGCPRVAAGRPLHASPIILRQETPCLILDPLSQSAVLLIIDVQKGMDDPRLGQRNNPNAEENMARLLAAWRKISRPVYHVQHLSLAPASPLRAELPGCEIKDEVRPLAGEPLFQKHVNSAFIGTELEQTLRAHGYESLVIVGLTTPHCVSTTARMAGNLGFHTTVVSDATAAFDVTGPDGRRHSAEEIHAVSLAVLHGEFAIVTDTETVLRALVASGAGKQPWPELNQIHPTRKESARP